MHSSVTWSRASLSNANPFYFHKYCSDMPNKENMMEYILRQLLPNHHRALKSLSQVRWQAQKLVAIRPKSLDEETRYYGPDQYATNPPDANGWFNKSYPVRSPPLDKVRRGHTYAIMLRDLTKDQCDNSSERGAHSTWGRLHKCPRTKRIFLYLTREMLAEQDDQSGLDGPGNIAWSQTRILAKQMRLFLLQSPRNNESINQTIVCTITLHLPGLLY